MSDITVSSDPAYVVPLQPWEEALMVSPDEVPVTLPNDDVRAARFRDLRAEVGGDMGRALELLDVARLRNGAYLGRIETLQGREVEQSLAIDQLTRQRDDFQTNRDYWQERAQAPVRLDDDRLSAEWERAGEIATEEGFCSEYDRMCERLGIPGRNREYRVQVTVTHEIYVHVTGRSEEDALENVTGDEVADAISNLAHWEREGSWEADSAEIYS